MALKVDYANRMGYFYLHTKDKQNKWKIWFCHSNALVAMVHFYKKDVDGKKEDWTELFGWFADLKHAERCIKDIDYFRNCSGFTFYAKEMSKDIWKLIKVMTKNGIKVTIK